MFRKFASACLQNQNYGVDRDTPADQIEYITYASVFSEKRDVITYMLNVRVELNVDAVRSKARVMASTVGQFKTSCIFTFTFALVPRKKVRAAWAHIRLVRSTGATA